MLNTQHVRSYQPSIQELTFNSNWITAVLTVSNQLLPATYKVTLIALKFEIDQVKRVSTLEPREDGLTPVFMPNLEKRTGQSSDVITSSLKAMEGAGIIERKLEQIDGFKRRLYISLCPNTLRLPSELGLKEERNIGGKRTKKDKKVPYCPDCGSYDVTVQKQHTILCRVEGTVHKILDGKPVMHFESDHDVIVPPTQEELDAYPPTFLDEIPLSQESITKEIERPYANGPVQLEANNWEEWKNALRPQPPLICRACTNSNPDRFRWLDLLAVYECSCGQRAKGR